MRFLKVECFGGCFQKAFEKCGFLLKNANLYVLYGDIRGFFPFYRLKTEKNRLVFAGFARFLNISTRVFNRLWKNALETFKRFYRQNMDIKRRWKTPVEKRDCIVGNRSIRLSADGLFGLKR